MTTDAPPVTLAEFLLARLAEDEAAALAASNPPWIALTFYPTRSEVTNEPRSTAVSSSARQSKDDQDAAHIARHDPERVLADVAAKRAVLELHRYCHRPSARLRPVLRRVLGCGRHGWRPVRTMSDCPCPRAALRGGAGLARGVGDVRLWRRAQSMVPKDRPFSLDVTGHGIQCPSCNAPVDARDGA